MDSTEYRDDMSGRRRSGPHDPRLRASDAERDAAAAVLRRHYTEGRLDAQEYNDRVERCYAAKTMGELDALFTDLPRTETREPEPEPSRASSVYRPTWLLAAIVPFVIALIVLSVLLHAHFFWLIWPLFFFVFRPFGLFGFWCRGGRGRRDGTGTRYV